MSMEGRPPDTPEAEVAEESQPTPLDATVTIDDGATIALTGVPVDPASTVALPAAGVGSQPGSAVVRITPDEAVPPVAAWPKARPGRRGRLLTVMVPLSILVTAGIAAFLLFNRASTSGPALSVTGVTITAPPTAGCGQVVTVSAIISTNAGAGTIAYRWSRSDGQQNPVQHLSATRDQTSYPVSLTWSIEGRGRLDAAATLTVSAPSGVSPAVARFVYSC